MMYLSLSTFNVINIVCASGTVVASSTAIDNGEDDTLSYFSKLAEEE